MALAQLPDGLQSDLCDVTAFVTLEPCRIERREGVDGAAVVHKPVFAMQAPPMAEICIRACRSIRSVACAGRQPR